MRFVRGGFRFSRIKIFKYGIPEYHVLMVRLNHPVGIKFIECSIEIFNQLFMSLHKL